MPHHPIPEAVLLRKLILSARPELLPRPAAVALDCEIAALSFALGRKLENRQTTESPRKEKTV